MSLTTTGRDSPVVFAPNSESEEWLREWQAVQAKDLIDSPIVEVEAESTVEEACEALLKNNAACLAIKSPPSESSPYLGLFDYADVNAFLTLAATQHTLNPNDLQDNPRIEQIVKAAKAGKVPVHLVSDLSEKNPLETLSATATIVDLLRLFGQGAHRILVEAGSDNASTKYLGIVSDRSLLSYFHSHAQSSPPLFRFLSNAVHSLSLPSFNLRSAVICCTASETVLDAMKCMSEQGVSSVAVIEDAPASAAVNLLSAVSVTDIGKIVVPSQSKHILSTPLSQFIAQIKEPDGSTDGEDKFPVYSISGANTLRYTMEKILATTAHRVFVTEDTLATTSPMSASPTSSATGNLQLRGVVSVVDVLSLFARLANIPDIDPTRMQRHRRASSASASSKSSKSNR